MRVNPWALGSGHLTKEGGGNPRMEGGEEGKSSLVWTQLGKVTGWE